MPHAGALSWSSGKDAAWALHVLQADPEFEIRVLLTTFNETFGRAAMHGTRRALVQAQARAVGLPLVEVPLPWPCPNDVYEDRLRAALQTLRAKHGVTHLAFGDLFLQDVRDYRIAQLRGTGIEPVFPLWQQRTAALAGTMLTAGVSAYLSCVDPRALDPGFAGRAWDAALLEALPQGVDPCGENGEFHTIVVDGPAFGHPLDVAPGEIVERDGFVFADFRLAHGRVTAGAQPCAS